MGWSYIEISCAAQETREKVKSPSKESQTETGVLGSSVKGNFGSTVVGRKKEKRKMIKGGGKRMWKK